MPTDHFDLIDRQFGSNAQSYVTSMVHAQGKDLARIAAIAQTYRPTRALDLGAGGGHVSYAVAPHVREVVACDLSAQMIEQIAREAEQRNLPTIRTQVAAAEDLPFADDSFDFLACRFSTHHWHDAEQGIREARRVLSPGAVAVFSDVAAPALPLADTFLQAVELLRDLSHVRDYTALQWTAMLEGAGFRVRTVTTGRLLMDFADWTGRMRTPPQRCAAIRTLQAAACREVAQHFKIEADGSFTIDTLLIEAD